MTSTETTSKTRSHRRIWWLLATLSMVLAGGMAARAWAFGGGPGFPGFGPGMHKEFMQKRLEKMLDDVKATDSQRTAIKNIAARLQSEMEPLHQEHKAIHEQMLKLFSADKVDGAAVEKLRTQGMALADKGSQALTRALVDAGNVLDAGQRQTIIKELQERHGRWHKQ
jgi:Spy/CpxP family protein refolding chaperone